MSSFIERRKHIRISLRGKIIEDLGLRNNVGTLVIDNLKHSCTIQNISVSGAFISTKDDLKIADNTPATLILNMTEGKQVSIKIDVLYSKPLNDIYNSTAYGLDYHEESVPESYKQHLDDFWRKSTL